MNFFNINKWFSLKETIFFAIVIVALTLNFNQNFFKLVPQSYFGLFLQYAESQAHGRLMQSKSDGVFSHGGFLGWVNVKDNAGNLLFPAGYNNSIPAGQYMGKFDYQIYLYENDLDGNTFEVYYSQPGFQCVFYSLITKLLGVKGTYAILVIQFINSFLLAVLLTIFIIWVYKNWGMTSAFFFTFFIINSQWLTLYSRSLYWATWAFYIPLIVPLIYIKGVMPDKEYPIDGFFKVIFWSILIKCLFNGFEFITASMIMSVTPIVFYAIINKLGWKLTINRLLAGGGGAILAVFFSLKILIIQISIVKGSVAKGFEHILNRLNERTYGTLDLLWIEHQDGIQRRLWDVLEMYWNSIAFELNSLTSLIKIKRLAIISYGDITIFIAIVSIIYLIIAKVKNNKSFYKSQIALIVTIWLSILAPLSWFTIFKDHSYNHAGQNPIVWYMPYMFFCYVLIANTISFGLKAIVKKIKPIYYKYLKKDM